MAGQERLELPILRLERNVLPIKTTALWDERFTLLINPALWGLDLNY